MADNNEDQEKTEAATPRRLEKAREDGQTARSRELSTFVMLLGGVIALWLSGGMLYGRLGMMMEQSFVFERAQAFDGTVMLMHAGSLGAQTLVSLLPLFLLLLVAALAAPMLLGGWLFSAKALRPQFSRLNPLKGLKRIFSARALAELGKVVATARLLGAVLVAFLQVRVEDFMILMQLPLSVALARALELAAAACGLMVLALLVVAGMDVPYQLWDHGSKLRMSREEIKREHKDSEGDPRIKARLRAQRQDMARRRMMSKVPEADVIVTNPTHYAVALRYEEGGMAAPRVVAKGTDAVAATIRELGLRHGVPLLEAPPLARALHTLVDLDHEIPAPLYAAVAEVLAWAFRLKRARGTGEDAPPPPRELDVPEGLGKLSARSAF